MIPQVYFAVPPIFYQSTTLPNSITPNLPDQNSIMVYNQDINQCPQKAINTCFLIASLNVPQPTKDNLIKNVLKNPDLKNNNIDTNLLKSADLNTKIKTKNHLNSNRTSRVKFTKEEDDKIKQLVEKFGTHHWNLIALCMERRTGKQCRDRYFNYLIPGCFQGEWSKEEDELLIQMYSVYGPKWAAIKKYFPNRGYNNIKSRWYFFLRKQKNSIQPNSVDDQIDLEKKNE